VSLPNGTVAMEFGRCPICPKSTVGSGVPLGINCGGCGHHFHIGTGDGGPLIGSKPIFCPRCEGACLGVEITEPAGFQDES